MKNSREKICACDFIKIDNIMSHGFVQSILRLNCSLITDSLCSPPMKLK